MGYAIGTVTSGPNAGNACDGVLDALVTLANANGWVTQRYVNTGSVREWIGMAVGNTGAESIYVGFKTYFNVGADYYNLKIASMVGYVSTSSFEAQPGAQIMGCPAHNKAVTYFINVNAHRIVGCLKVGTPVYTHFYAGNFLPYARPGEYPSPLAVGAMFSGAGAKRFSDNDLQWPYFGQLTPNSVCVTRDQAGNWSRRWHLPYCQGGYNTQYSFGGGYQNGGMVPAGDHYSLEPIVMMSGGGQGSENTPANIYGELDGVYFVSGFNNTSENVMQIGGNTVVDQAGMTVLQAVTSIRAAGGRAFVILQNTNKTTWRDFIAMEMN